MPIYQYSCDSCHTITELYQTSTDGGPKTIKCKSCKGIAKKILSTVSFRMDGKLFTPGGPTYQDQKDDIGPITGDLQEESAKEFHDYNQAKAKGKESEYVFGKGCGGDVCK